MGEYVLEDVIVSECAFVIKLKELNREVLNWGGLEVELREERGHFLVDG